MDQQEILTEEAYSAKLGETDKKLTGVGLRITEMIKGLADRQTVLKNKGMSNQILEARGNGKNKGIQVSIRKPIK